MNVLKKKKNKEKRKKKPWLAPMSQGNFSKITPSRLKFKNTLKFWTVIKKIDIHLLLG